MRFTSEQRFDDGTLEREFLLGEVPGILWTPTSAPAPLILLAHPGGLRKMYPRLAGRARAQLDSEPPAFVISTSTASILARMASS